ncbi:protein-glutamate O-methyltransferase CheR [Erythrobacter sp. SCSIO 43205]|uniref:CheR family methyltransferase n=1 Tax=Erythrobacter sp. SCSIO 43205 TaxID=2779361 RepID=UPI001CA7CC04|nr:protein-glutamate O-methyltransferase CheR [Erythrobacter sp. SCSIO 43205]UAB77968.1 protein-glutamate O-methyltransferase CheR [Erythrobacter sp. SCSIO 43205]
MEHSEASYQIIVDLLFERTGQHLAKSRQWRLGSALSEIFRKHGIKNLDQLVCLLDAPQSHAKHGDLATEVVEALLNNETYFFRDKPTFDQIPQFVLPQLRERRAHTRHLSIWCAGCSTGQEVYSLAMLFEEQKELWEGWTINLLGTDISHGAIKTAKAGIYGQFEIQRGLGVGQMLAHFTNTSGGWQVSEKLRQNTRFGIHNLLNQPPGRSTFDLILCRNVLLYFGAGNRKLALQRLAKALARDGFLMLGNGETASVSGAGFALSPERASIFEINPQKRETVNAA